MNRSPALAVAALAAILPLASSCVGTPGDEGLPIVARATVRGPDGSPVMDYRTDGDIFVGFAEGTGEAEVFAKAVGIPVMGPVATGTGFVFVMRRSADFAERFAPGAVLPHWLDDYGFFRPGEAQALGYQFAPDPEPASFD